MYVIKVIKNSTVTNMGEFANEAEAQEWLSYCLSKGKFGDPSTFEIVQGEVIPSYADLRRVQYALRIDPFIAEALTDKEAGDSARMSALLTEKAAIKLEIPKPE